MPLGKRIVAPASGVVPAADVQRARQVEARHALGAAVVAALADARGARVVLAVGRDRRRLAVGVAAAVPATPATAVAATAAAVDPARGVDVARLGVGVADGAGDHEQRRDGEGPDHARR